MPLICHTLKSINERPENFHFLYLIFYVFDKRINSEVLMSGILFGIGINALIVRKLFKENKDYLGRGILVSSFFYFLFWVIKFII